jgi:hypothetical protein
MGEPLLPDDASTLIHLIWRNGALIDLAGNKWKTVGAGPTYSPPQGRMPAGARLFSGANHIELGTGVDVSDVVDFLGVVIATPVAADAHPFVSMFLSNMSPTSGWELVANEARQVRWYAPGAAFSEPLTIGEPNVVAFACMGSWGAWTVQNAVKVNGGPMVSAVGSLVLPTDSVLKVGCHWDDISGFAGTIYEVLLSSLNISSQDPLLVDAQLSRLTNIAFTRMGLRIAEGPYSAPWAEVIAYGYLAIPDLTRASMIWIAPGDSHTFAVSAPIRMPGVRRFSVTISNATGGALGAVTWDSVYKMSAWTHPANGYNRTITFEMLDELHWVESARTPVDVPN